MPKPRVDKPVDRVASGHYRLAPDGSALQRYRRRYERREAAYRPDDQLHKAISAGSRPALRRPPAYRSPCGIAGRRQHSRAPGCGRRYARLADEFPEVGVLAPPSIGGTPVVLALDVADAEAAFARWWRRTQRFVSRWRTCSGATGTANLRTRSGITGASVSTCATCHAMRSSPPPHRRSAECITDR
jgi:hypothetical protein